MASRPSSSLQVKNPATPVLRCTGVFIPAVLAVLLAPMEAGCSKNSPPVAPAPRAPSQSSDTSLELAPAFYPHVCATWSEDPSDATQALLGSYEIVSLSGETVAGTVKLENERIWVHMKHSEQQRPEPEKPQQDDSSSQELVLKPWYHPTERQFCLDLMGAPIVLNVSPARADGTVLIEPTIPSRPTEARDAPQHWEVYIHPGTNLILRRLGDDIATRPPETVGEAIRAGTLADLKELLAEESPAADPDDATPLQIAVHEMQTRMVELLLARGAAVDATGEAEGHMWPTYRNDRPLTIAVRNRHFRMAKLLLQAGAQPDEALRPALVGGFTPPELLELLIRAGAKWQDDEFVQYQLPRVEPLLSALLRHGLDPNSTVALSSERVPLLHATIRLGTPSMVRRLLVAKADITRVDEDGDSPLDVAIRQAKSAEVTRMLFEAGAKLNPERHEEMFEAALENRALFAELLKRGVSATTEMDGRSLLHVVAERAVIEEVELVLRAGGDPRAEDDEGRLPVDVTDDEEVASLLRRAMGQARSDDAAPKGATTTLTRDGMVRIPGEGRGAKDFWLDRTEVTVASYRECVEAGKCTPPVSSLRDGSTAYDAGGRDQHPVSDVTFAQAETYCRFRRKRLPTDRELALASVGRDQSRSFPWGNGVPSCERAVIADPTSGCGAAGSHPVGSKPRGASPEGVLDLIGNVAEWTSDARRSRQPWGYDFSTPVRDITWGRSDSLSPDYESARWLGFRCASSRAPSGG
jgi:ankyrin repeat protein